MNKKTKKGFLGKLFGGNKTDSCCSVEFEEIPEIETNQTESDSAKHSEKGDNKNTGCGCGS